MGDNSGGGQGPYQKRPIPDLTKFLNNLKKFIIKAEDNTKILAPLFSRHTRKNDPINQVKVDRFGDHILVTVVNEEQAKLINKANFAGHKVRVEAPYFLNTVKGIIYFQGLCWSQS